MNYYSHNIGDFDRATRHLSRLERSIYRDLLDVYYDTEEPLTLDLPKLKRKILANSNEESTGVEQVLNEFFIQTPNGWFHSRCDEEISIYRASNTQKAQAGKASAAAKAARKLAMLNGTSTDVERALNGTSTALQLNNNQEPITNNQEPMSLSDDKDTGVVDLPKAGDVCKAMKAAGLQSVNPSNADLLTLIDAGVLVPDFVEAAGLAVAQKKGFAWALGVVKNKRSDAQRKAQQPSIKNINSKEKHANHSAVEAI